MDYYSKLLCPLQHLEKEKLEINTQKINRFSLFVEKDTVTIYSKSKEVP